MIPALIAVGVVYLLLRDREAEPDEEVEDFTPRDDMPEETIENVYSGDGFSVFKVGILMGSIRFDNDERRYEYTYVIGDESGSGFVSANSDRGTRTIQGQPRVLVFATKRDAIEYAERPRDNDPNDPTSPQPQPQPEDDEPSPPPPSPPQLPPTLGGGMTNLSSGVGGY